MAKECLDYVSIRIAMYEAVTGDLSIGENLEDITDSDLEIEILMKIPYSRIDDLIVSTFYTKDENDISTKSLK